MHLIGAFSAVPVEEQETVVKAFERLEVAIENIIRSIKFDLREDDDRQVSILGDRVSKMMLEYIEDTYPGSVRLEIDQP
jgi:hypothetical protein